MRKKKWIFFWLFFLLLRVRSPGRKKTGSPESGHLKICRTSGPDVMSGWALPLCQKGDQLDRWVVKILICTITLDICPFIRICNRDDDTMWELLKCLMKTQVHRIGILFRNISPHYDSPNSSSSCAQVKKLQFLTLRGVPTVPVLRV